MPTPSEMLGSLNGTSMAGGADMIRKYLKDGGVGLNPSQLAWCAAAVNSSLSQAGMQGTGSPMARSFMKWGQGTDTPQPGDIAVFSRGDPKSASGHVGFFQGYDDAGNIKVLGGNQDDGVNVKSFPKDRLLGFRSVGGQESPSNQFNAAPSPIPFQQPATGQGYAAAPGLLTPGNQSAPTTATMASLPTSLLGTPTGDQFPNFAQNGITPQADPAAKKKFDFAGLGNMGASLMAAGAPKPSWTPGAPAQVHRPELQNLFAGLLGGY